MKNLKFFVFVLLSILLSNNVYSRGRTSIHFGPSFPVYDFASDDFDDDAAGGAATGINVGLQYVYPLSKNGLGIFGGIDFNFNGLNEDVKDDMEEYIESTGTYNANIKYYNYINVPLTAGLNYSYIADDNIGVFANAGLALNFLKITNMEIEANDEIVSQEMELANSIGYKIGGGIMINKKTYISIDYLALGKHDLDGVMKSSVQSEDLDGEAKVDLFTLTLGFRF